jgi:4-hydroxy-tetrahydrodipicolinate reductase
MADMKIAISGAGGRMGRTLTRIVHQTEGCVVAGGIEPEGSPFVGEDMGTLAGIGPIGVAVSDDPLGVIVDVEGLVDFTAPAASVVFAGLAAQARIVHVLGTTGLGAADEEKIAAAARHATIVKSGNMSLGVNLLAALTRKVAAVLGEEFDIEVVEMHHRHKVDAPSGTALLLGRAAAEGRDITLEQRSVRSRDGHTGARQKGDIGFATLRGGSVVGEHTVIFAGEAERIEIAHKAESRDIFARGAVRAALWARGRAPGIYTMADVLGLDDI